MLPWVLMGRRAAFQQDLGCSPYQLTFGQAAVLPGALIDDPHPIPSKPELQTMLQHLEAAADVPAVPMSRHGAGPKAYTNNIESATHVYLRVDNPQGLQPRWHGPYPITKRTGETTFEVRTGTYKSGEARLELHSWNNAKPAFMAEGMTEASRPKLGRPSKPTAPPSSSESDSLMTVSTENDAERPVSKQPPPRPVSKQPPPAPSSHSMKLRKRVTAVSDSAGNSNDVIPHTWSASKQDIDELNASINQKSI